MGQAPDAAGAELICLPILLPRFFSLGLLSSCNPESMDV